MGRYSARIDRSSNNIDYLHKVALDKLTRIITSTDGRRKREIKISIPKADRLAAIKKLGKLKNEKSIKVLTFLCIEGVFTTYSPQRGAEGGESALTRESTDIRLNSYKSLLNYDKTAMSEDNKKITIYTILNSIRHEREDAVTYYALSAAEKFSVFFNDSAKIFVNSLFSKQARNLVVKRKFRIIYLAIRVSKALKHKSGVEFLDKLLLSGITGRLYTYALKAKAQLKAGN
jgi:hypothetical protein